jgi:hypothetical protein
MRLMANKTLVSTGAGSHVFGSRKDVGLRLAASGVMIAVTLLIGFAFPNEIRSEPKRDSNQAVQETIADLAILGDGADGYTVFVIDEKSDLIYSRKVISKSDVEFWTLDDFESRRPGGSEVPKNPTALAVQKGVLYVLDGPAQSVFAIDLENYSSRQLLGPPTLSAPISIAVSEEGILAIGQARKGVFVYDPRSPAIPPTQLPGFMRQPRRLQFVPSRGKDPSILLVLDTEKLGFLTVYTPKAAGSRVFSRNAILIPRAVIDRIGSSGSVDVAYVGGNYHLTDGRNWTGFTRSGLARTRWVLFPDMYKVLANRFQGIGNSLFVLDKKHRQVWRLSLAPMTLRMEASAAEANALLGDLYQSLYDKGALPEREYIVSTEKSRLVDLLKSERVLAEGNYSSAFPATWPVAPQTFTPQQKFEHTFCLLNKAINNWQCPDASSPDFTERLKHYYGSGQALVIPGIGVEGVRYEGTVELGNRTVEQAVKERLTLADPYAIVTTKDLMRINPGYYRTLEYEMTKNDYILTSPARPDNGIVTPGALMTIAENHEVGLNAASAPCTSTWPEITGHVTKQSASFLSDKLHLYDTNLEYLPRIPAAALDDRSILTEWKKRGIALLEIAFDSPVETCIRLEDLVSGTTPACWARLAGPNNYLVTDVITAAAIKYRFLRRDGEVVAIKNEELTRWGLAGAADDSGDWSVKVSTPYVIAYRALPWDGQPFVKKSSSPNSYSEVSETRYRFASDPNNIKRGSGQNIWTKVGGKFVLPGLRWEVKLLTDSSMLAGGSVIRDWAAKYRTKVSVSPLVTSTTGLTNSQAMANTDDASNSEQDLGAVSANRTQLRKAISFPDGAKTDDISIGLMERSRSIEELNPDFAWRKVEDGCQTADNCAWEFVWLEQTTDESNPLSRLRHETDSSVTRQIRTNEQIEPVDEYWKRNHGTHIAGLLASNNKDVMGLVPDATLCWFELGNPPTPLEEQITLKNSNSLSVINISQAFESLNYDWLIDRIGLENSDLASKLFVIAAGNDGLNLNTATASEIKRPVAWLHNANSLLSVSATDMNQKLLFRPEQFRSSDLKNAAGLATKLKDSADLVSQHLFGKLSADLQQQLRNFDPSGPLSDSLKTALLTELNQLLTGPSLFDEQRFTQVQLRKETQALIAQNPAGKKLLQLNRLLIEDAFSDEIVRSSNYLVNYGVRYVDLLAPGQNIYSSTEAGAYAAATGTSQAAPLVSATAALLVRELGRAVDPSLLKARLIYTADWEGRNLEERSNWEDENGYLDKVWGGALNAGRAVFGYDRDLFLHEFGVGTRNRAIRELPSHVKLKIKNWKSGEAFFVDQPTAASGKFKRALTEADQQVDFDQVLRLLRLKNNLYRIVFKDREGRLRIIMNASVEGSLKYQSYEDIVDGAFIDQPRLPQPVSISFDKIIDYVAKFSKMGTKISF